MLQVVPKDSSFKRAAYSNPPKVEREQPTASRHLAVEEGKIGKRRFVRSIGVEGKTIRNITCRLPVERVFGDPSAEFAVPHMRRVCRGIVIARVDDSVTLGPGEQRAHVGIEDGVLDEVINDIEGKR